MKSIAIRPNAVPRGVAVFLAFWIIVAFSAAALSLLTLVALPQLAVLAIMSAIGAILWSGWHALLIHEGAVTLRFSRYGCPFFLRHGLADLKRATLHIQPMFSTNGRPQVYLDLLGRDGRIHRVPLGFFTPSQGQQFVDALSEMGVAVDRNISPSARKPS